MYGLINGITTLLEQVMTLRRKCMQRRTMIHVHGMVSEMERRDVTYVHGIANKRQVRTYVHSIANERQVRTMTHVHSIVNGPETFPVQFASLSR